VALVLAFLLFGAEEWLQKGIAALKAGNVVEARTALEEAVKLAPAEPVMWLAVADARLRSGDAALAVAALDRAAKLAPCSPVAWAKSARGCSTLDRRNEPKRCCKWP
jgi:Flp pilus assembly protein TadD